MKDSEWGFNDKPKRERVAKTAVPVKIIQEAETDTPTQPRERTEKITAAKRERAIKEGKPKRERTAKVGNSKFILIASVACALGIGGISGYLVGAQHVTEVATQSVINNMALNATNLASLTPGFTAQKVLDSATTQVASKQYDKLISELTSTLSANFGSKFKEVTPATNIPLMNDKSAGSMTYQVNSTSFFGEFPILNSDQRKKAIEIVNGVVTKAGFDAFNLESMYTGSYADEGARVTAFGNANPLLSQHFNIIGGSKSDSLSRYIVGISDSKIPDKKTSGVIDGSTITVTFTSFPHIKDGTQEEFKRLVSEEYAAKKFVKANG